MADGNTTWPTDSGGQTAVGMIIGGNIYYFQGDNSTAKNLKVALYDATGAVLLTSGNPAYVNAFVQATTTGGTTPYTFLSTAAVQSASIKGSAGQVYALHFFNTSATIAYVRLYNQTGAPASTDTANIVYRALVPGNTSGAGFVVPIPPGVVFGTGIGIRVTAAVADNDTTALAANVVLGNVFFK